MNVLILGLGSIGSRHVRNLVSFDEVRRIYVHDVEREKVNKTLSLSPKVKAFEWEDKEPIDLTLICTPNHTHCELATEFLDRGSHIFVEKPLGITPEEGETVVEKAKEVKKEIIVASNMRYHIGVEEAKRCIEKGTLGSPLFARAYFGHYLPNWRPDIDYRSTYSAKAKEGGGVIFDCIHELDYLMWLFGDVVEFYGMYSKSEILDIDVEDLGVYQLRHSSGVISMVHVDYIQRLKKRGLEIIGTERSFHWESTGKIPEIVEIEVYDLEETSIRRFYQKDSNYMYVRQLRHLISYLLYGKDGDQLLKGKEAVKELHILEKIKLEGHR